MADNDEEEFEFPPLDVYASRVFSMKSLGVAATVVIVAAVLYRSQNYSQWASCR